MPDEFVTLIDFVLESSGMETGRRYYSFEGVRTPSINYGDDVRSIGAISRSIGPVNEPYSVGNVSIDYINRGRQFSILKSTERFKGRRNYINFASLASGYAARLPVYTGAIDTWSISGGVCSVSLRDVGFDRFKKPLRTTLKTLNANVFPSLPASLDEVLVPVIYGDVSTNGGALLTAGPVPCYLIDEDVGGKWRYVVAQHVCKSVDTIYVYGDSGHGITTTVTTASYDGVSMTVIDFDSDPRNTDRASELEVTALVKGTTDDGTTSGTLIENPAAIHKHIMTNWVGWDVSEQDASLYTAAVDAADDNMLSGSAAPYLGCVVLAGGLEQTWFDIVNAMTNSWLLYTFVTAENLLGVYLLTLTTALTAPTATVAITDSQDIGRLSITGNRNVYSEIHYRWVYNWTLNTFVSSLLAATGEDIMISEPRSSEYLASPLPSTYLVEPVDFDGGAPDRAPTADTDTPDAVPALRELEYVADPDTAESVASTYALLASERVEFVTVDLPARFIGAIDINDIVSVTDWQGISASGGYSAAVFRIIGVEINLQPDAKGLRCTGIKLAA